MHRKKGVKYVRRRKRPGSIKWLMKILTLILILFASYFFINSPFFAVSSIKVSGTKLVSVQDIVELSGLAKGQNIFKIDREKAEKKILMSPMVDDVEIERHLPGTVAVLVTERTPVALVPIAGGLIQIDVAGYILKKVSAIDKYPLPIVTGVDLPDTIAVGKQLTSQKLAMGLKMIAQMDAEAKKVIAEVDVFDPQKLRVFTVQGAEVRLGGADGFQEKFTRFLQVLKKEEEMDRLEDIEYIDVSFSDKPVVFYRKN
ncbi:cell division protein FtsQ/DivIB [Candidatus Formimonas warabiya]|uniref:POTRA domain-containing protein n=1 Tax=Formimonas warabiya TaxID=1761012 RepID=A0A3G1KRF3_FORW1|nr:FtsQ-type POTRA domain-containing protein [Candidatus Formimonas warabiya]ATW25053.1 hypothetical protein DCMF_09930 [Candidatus Formimonas warabiya]